MPTPNRSSSLRLLCPSPSSFITLCPEIPPPDTIARAAPALIDVIYLSPKINQARWPQNYIQAALFAAGVPSAPFSEPGRGMAEGGRHSKPYRILYAWYVYMHTVQTCILRARSTYKNIYRYVRSTKQAKKTQLKKAGNTQTLTTIWKETARNNTAKHNKTRLFEAKCSKKLRNTAKCNRCKGRTRPKHQRNAYIE